MVEIQPTIDPEVLPAVAPFLNVAWYLRLVADVTEIREAFPVVEDGVPSAHPLTPAPAKYSPLTKSPLTWRPELSRRAFSVFAMAQM